MERLKQVADCLHVDVVELFSNPNKSNDVTGYLEYNGEVMKITSNEDLFKLADKIKSQNINSEIE